MLSGKGVRSDVVGLVPLRSDVIDYVEGLSGVPMTIKLMQKV